MAKQYKLIEKDEGEKKEKYIQILKEEADEVSVRELLIQREALNRQAVAIEAKLAEIAEMLTVAGED